MTTYPARKDAVGYTPMGPFGSDYNGGFQDGWDGAPMDPPVEPSPLNGLAASAYREGYRAGMAAARLQYERGF